MVTLRERASSYGSIGSFNPTSFPHPFSPHLNPYQEAKGKRQKAKGKRQKAIGNRQ
ncbi:MULTISPECIES: hypothetical protein [unclassified Moorena]|uniref:hypothetical protein n=1 Tax=unclassified Moorena TaxID=2683338 RepID=UPI0013FF1993|nr:MULTISPECIES: hypothetical protein [unclassified Moorena]NEO17390.1 hypothetical protein [Moorena sp. SIO3E8]NEQ03947.1 hypothetical protein [Moorena sp. SIO3F7]